MAESGWRYHNEKRAPSRKFFHLWKATLRITKLPNEPYVALAVYKRGMFGDEKRLKPEDFASWIVTWAVDDSGYVGADASTLFSYAKDRYDELTKSKKPMRYVRLLGVDEYGRTEVIW